MEIKVDDLSGGEVLQLLEEHLADMYATSPPESVHALDVEGLKSPDITFFSGWLDGRLQGCVALKSHSDTQVELKSMRTTADARNRGVASKLLSHVLDISKTKGYQKISLETGSEEYFKPARKLYEKFGFQYCDPFADYVDDPNSRFMTRSLKSDLI